MAEARELPELTAELLDQWERDNDGPPGDDYGMWHANEIAALIVAARRARELEVTCKAFTGTLDKATNERNLWKRRFYLVLEHIASALGNNHAHRVKDAVLRESEAPNA